MATRTAKTRRSGKKSSKKASKQDSWLAAGFGPPASPFKMGDVIDGRWQLKRKLGEGGMGAVWEAQHLVNGRKVALKFMLSDDGKPSPLAIEMFNREGEIDNIIDRAAGRPPRDGAVEVYDNGILPSGSPFMVMEALKGNDLDGLARKGQLSYEAALEATYRTLHVLEGAHQHGIIHRDIKPANVFLEDDGGLRVLDTGLASMRGRKDFPAGTSLGTPSYMAPEQAAGGARSAGPEADVYGVAAMLYWLLSGHTPTTTMEDAAACNITPIEVVAPHIPAYLAGVVNKGISCKPKDRFRSAAEMSAVLEPLVAEMRYRRQYPQVEEAVQQELHRLGA